MIKYAGIGSRETPPNVLEQMREWGEWFAQAGVMLRSGGARGADQAFERGCNAAMPPWLPYQIFTANMSIHYPAWLDHAAKFHPAWDRCSEYARLLHARNSAIILGSWLNEPVNFVVCWTKDGKASGGTGQALRIAEAYKIPVFNFFNDPQGDQLREWVKQL